MTGLPTLTDAELERYARHIVLRDVGGPGQQRLKAGRVLVIGAGGLGSPLIAYLAASGVGAIGVVDDDIVSLSNLQRQIIHSTRSICTPKVESAASAVAELNPHVRVISHPIRIDAANAPALLTDYDVIADGSDNFDTRYTVSDACFHARKALVTATLNQFDGSLTTLRPFEMGPEGFPNPTWRCLFPDQPPPGMIPTCSDAGILGPVAGVLGSMMALEVIRELLGGFFPGDRGLVGEQLLVDLRGLRFDRIGYDWDPDNPLNGRTAAR